MATFDFNSYKNYVNGNNNMYTSTIKIGNNPFGCNSRGIDILSSVFNIAAMVTCYAVQPGTSGGGGGGSTAKASAQVKIAEAEIKVETLEKEIKALSCDVISKESYNAKKTELNNKLSSLETQYNVSDGEGKTKKQEYENACVSYNNALEKQTKYNEKNAELQKCIAKPRGTHVPIDITKNDGGLTIEKYDAYVYDTKEKDENGLLKKDTSTAERYFNEDKRIAAEANAEYTRLKNELAQIGEKTQIEADVINTKNAKEAKEKELDKAMGGDGSSSAYMNAKKGIEEELATLEVKYNGSAGTQKIIDAKNTELVTARSELTQARLYIERLETADDSVALAKAEKKKMKKNQLGDGNFFTRLFSKSQRAQHKKNVAQTKEYDNRIAEAQRKRDVLE